MCRYFLLRFKFDIIPIEEYNITITEKGRDKMEYITSTQASEIWGISRRRISLLCAENRIDGAVKMGKVWFIPKDAEKPIDRRLKITKVEK